MTQPQREELFAILMEGISSAEEVGEQVHREMVDFTTGDLDRLEPIIDRMVNEAFQAGKRFADRKTEADIVNPRETVIVL